jgi:hypothetical protein
MGRIHRYGQKHDPVFLLNLVAGKTREGRVLRTLLDKLERIRKELHSDKVFDVVGRMFEGKSLREYLEQALTEEGAEAVSRRIEGTLTREQVVALAERERRLYGDGGDVKARLEEQTAQQERERWRRLIPGYVRRFLVHAAPLLQLGFDGELDDFFSLVPQKPHALDPLLPFLEPYQPEQCRRLTLSRPTDPASCLFLHPGEPFFDQFRSYVCTRFADAAVQGAVFVDPWADRPYLFHLLLVTVQQQADPQVPAFSRSELLDCQLVGVKQVEGEQVEPCAVEQLLLLRGGAGIPLGARTLASQAAESCQQALVFAREQIAQGLAQKRVQALRDTLPDRLEFAARGYDYQDAELAARRAKLNEKARVGDPRAKGEISRIKDQQRSLLARKEAALAVLRREPELIAPGEATFLVHALIVPSNDPEDRRRHDADIEAIAVRIAWAHEVTSGAVVQDVSTAALAVQAGLVEHPGFDLLSNRPLEGQRAIEVKGRAGVGEIELTENEWVQACNHRDRYWLYVVFDCASPTPRLIRVQDPFAKLIVKARGSVVIDAREILKSAEADPR